jgi:putative endonuclease
MSRAELWALGFISFDAPMVRTTQARHAIRLNVERRIAEHQAGKFGGFTAERRPVELVFSEYFERIVDAVAMERRVKGWSRAKKEALMAGDFDRIRALSRRRT